MLDKPRAFLPATLMAPVVRNWLYSRCKMREGCSVRCDSESTSQSRKLGHGEGEPDLLQGRQFTADDAHDFVRELAEHLALDTPKQERPQHLDKQARGSVRGCAGGEGAGQMLANTRGGGRGRRDVEAANLMQSVDDDQVLLGRQTPTVRC